MFKFDLGSELHFRVVVVSDKFEDTPMLQVRFTVVEQIH